MGGSQLVGQLALDSLHCCVGSGLPVPQPYPSTVQGPNDLTTSPFPSLGFMPPPGALRRPPDGWAVGLDTEAPSARAPSRSQFLQKL